MSIVFSLFSGDLRQIHQGRIVLFHHGVSLCQQALAADPIDVEEDVPKAEEVEIVDQESLLAELTVPEPSPTKKRKGRSPKTLPPEVLHITEKDLGRFELALEKDRSKGPSHGQDNHCAQVLVIPRKNGPDMRLDLKSDLNLDTVKATVLSCWRPQVQFIDQLRVQEKNCCHYQV